MGAGICSGRHGHAADGAVEVAAASAGRAGGDESALAIKLESDAAVDGSTEVTRSLSRKSLAAERAEADQTPKRQRSADLEGVLSQAAAPHVLRVRTAAGSVVVSLALAQCTGMPVRALRQKVLDALGQSCQVKLVVAARELLDAESLDDLVRVGEVVEILMVASQLPRLDPEKPPMEQLGILKDMIMSSSVEHQLDGATHLRRLLSREEDPPIQAIVDLGVVPRLVQLAGEPGDTAAAVQMEALWGLTNIGAGTSEQTQVVVDAGTLPVLARVLEEAPSDEILEQAMWLVGNVAGDSIALRDAAHAAGLLLPMLRLLDRDTPEHTCVGTSFNAVVREGTWALSNMCRGTPTPPLERLVPALPVISRLLQSQDQQVQADAAWAASYVAGGPSEHKGAAVEAGLCPHLAALLCSDSPLRQTPALRAMGGLVEEGGDPTQRVVDAGVLPALVRLLSSGKRAIRKEACWTLSHIFASSRQQVHAAIELGVLTSLVDILSERDEVLLRNAVVCLTNASAGGPPGQLHRLVDCGGLEAVAQLLALGDEGLQLRVLEFFGGVLGVQESPEPPGAGESGPFAVRVRDALSWEALEPLLNGGDEVAEKAAAIAQLLYP